MYSVNIRFWGVRGSKPTPGRQTMGFGGNTSCVQVQIGERILLFDGGTGLAEFGNHMLKKQQLNASNGVLPKIEADIFFSHLHWDHIQGLPFFVPMYVPGNIFHLYGENKENLNFQEVIEMQMKPPHFPITMKMMKASYHFHEVSSGETIDIGDGIKITSFAVKHPNDCLAYRVNYEGVNIVYCTDTEPMEGAQEEQFLSFVNGADVLIYDTHYTNQEYLGTNDDPPKKGWGHSTWQEGVRICRNAGIYQFVMFHHKENRSDQEMQQLESQVQEIFPRTAAAREGMVIKVGGDNLEKVVINYP
ncbi:MBL fold metallo-hydrolase [Desulfuribacillus alkaliarsenatis]|uniref:Metallo-beta-lactamase domain-containing protein n=1 Tax=Desulfuribacillus alkaliarsenatis TaxID=766136 RepID=A0A1E5G1S3_9FIRM|nr:MBL fold metallo-hydrolase [Desulfuribacillus alkaliarsenatis]OEF96858.1 hypothetical protein BHF68_07300 [Desulfuribacillus alkaliarsenatis]